MFKIYIISFIILFLLFTVSMVFIVIYGNNQEYTILGLFLIICLITAIKLDKILK